MTKKYFNNYNNNNQTVLLIKFARGKKNTTFNQSSLPLNKGNYRL